VLDTILIRAVPRVLNMDVNRGFAPPVSGRRSGAIDLSATRRADDWEPMSPPVNIPPPGFIHDFSPRPVSIIRASAPQQDSNSGEDRLFFDLVSYAPGMNTSRADILTILEAESVPMPANRLGRISPEARKLFEQARRPGWQRFEVAREADKPACVIDFDGQGRY